VCSTPTVERARRRWGALSIPLWRGPELAEEVIVIEPGAVSAELVDHITHGETKQAIEQFYDATAITAGDVAQIIGFAVSRSRSVSINEILVRPTAQA
jgi:NADP-dependent 3-hydroxy acid dehydrogenase YdfG